MRRSLNKINLMESPEPTSRDIPEIENHNIEDLNIEISEVSVSSSIKKSKKHARKSYVNTAVRNAEGNFVSKNSMLNLNQT